MSEPVYNQLRLGLNIRMRRHILDLTQKELAAKIGCSTQTLSLVERGKQDISVDMLMRLCRALSCSAKDLLMGV